jgi:hypothetical protein
MKKVLISFLTVCMVTTLMAGDEKYYQKMGEALTRFATISSMKEYQELANTFSNIARVETGEWLPLYYETQCYILMSFTNTLEPSMKDTYLDQAEKSLDRMLELVPEESEVYAQQALYHTARMVVNPMERAQYTASLISAAVEKSLSLDPSNPRAKYVRLTNEIGTAQFFGNDTQPYCQSARDLLDLWDTFIVKSPLHPAWGREMVRQIVENCDQ